MSNDKKPLVLEKQETQIETDTQVLTAPAPVMDEAAMTAARQLCDGYSTGEVGAGLVI